MHINIKDTKRRRCNLGSMGGMTSYTTAWFVHNTDEQQKEEKRHKMKCVVRQKLGLFFWQYSSFCCCCDDHRTDEVWREELLLRYDESKDKTKELCKWVFISSLTLFTSQLRSQITINHFSYRLTTMFGGSFKQQHRNEANESKIILIIEENNINASLFWIFIQQQ